MNVLQVILIGLIHIYRYVISPAKVFLFGPYAKCRYTPSCSEYALQAIRQEGVIRGFWLSATRICRCHPWGGCGYDPVPEAERSVATDTPNASLSVPVQKETV